MKFIIISAFYNMAEQLTDNINILKKQTVTNFSAYLGDDLSTDNSCDVVKKAIGGDTRFTLIKHQEKLFSLGNICTLIEQAKPEDEDIIVLVDGDDKLAHELVLKKLEDIYKDPDCWMTYGSFADQHGVRNKIAKEYSQKTIKNNSFRSERWHASHLKTFKYKLWKQVKAEDFTLTEQEYKQVIRYSLLTGHLRQWWHFKNVKYADLITENKRFSRRLSDKLITLPLLEMAGIHSRYIHEILYTYNYQPTPLNFNNSSKKWAQRFIRTAAFMKKAYQPL